MRLLLPFCLCEIQVQNLDEDTNILKINPITVQIDKKIYFTYTYLQFNYILKNKRIFNKWTIYILKHFLKVVELEQEIFVEYGFKLWLKLIILNSKQKVQLQYNNPKSKLHCTLVHLPLPAIWLGIWKINWSGTKSRKEIGMEWIINFDFQYIQITI